MMSQREREVEAAGEGMGRSRLADAREYRRAGEEVRECRRRRSFEALPRSGFVQRPLSLHIGIRSTTSFVTLLCRRSCAGITMVAGCLQIRQACGFGLLCNTAKRPPPAPIQEGKTPCKSVNFCADGYLLGSYRIATAPEPNSSRLMSLKSICFDSPANTHEVLLQRANWVPISGPRRPSNHKKLTRRLGPLRWRVMRPLRSLPVARSSRDARQEAHDRIPSDLRAGRVEVD